ncbi:MAG: DUF4259 domain-containing protein [Abitibacteriaceae bacterium]|nr:DUF4259 domain-containing protein [Abditibacteriaceae bacterium]MBV9867088.1 DUF4259 domain-containing protein [Abditibacteriaceae bacterium]
MGTWGSGNFENDGALDYVGSIIVELRSRIERCLADEDAVALDEEGEAVVVPSVQIIALLCEHCKAAPPEASVVARWKDEYFAVFDEQIDSLEPKPGFKERRRAVILATFDHLEKEATEFWSRV